MGLWKLCAALLPVLLLLCAGAHEVSHVKTTGRGPDVTLICPNTTDNMIVLTVCKIQTQRSRGAECLLTYRHDEGNFVHECDSRFTLQTDSEGVVLNLRNLSQEDSGNISCKCVHQGGTDTVRLSVTVEEKQEGVSLTDTPEPGSQAAVGLMVTAAGLAFVMVTAAVLALMYRKMFHRRQTEAACTPADTEDVEPYSTFTQSENVLYSTLQLSSHT